ncbi:hypothetical protein M9Y10_036684 [Tritrichomonas musculus]|uniref:DUF3447 domain-containing protein n=1 Tax=Tritrichomonas musculus TaxID=1915356 RepID=A0ABR2GTI4_9EUKA
MSESDNIERNKIIQEKLLDFLDDEISIEKLKFLFDQTKIRQSQHELKLFLRMLVKTSNDHRRGPNFFRKIDEILQFFKEDIKKYGNQEIFNLFKSNKRILLFLIEEKILTVDEYFYRIITSEKYSSKKYPQYFRSEIKPFMKAKWYGMIMKNLPKDFYENRIIGENENIICKMIREDSIKDFVLYMNESGISCNTKINLSIYETNSFLLKKTKGVKLIEYAAFFGSIKIFNFLRKRGDFLEPSLWLYAIHSNNAKLIHILEENQIIPRVTVHERYQKFEVESYEECLKESIKCHHNEIADYLLNNYLKDSSDTLIQGLKYYNFWFIQKECINEKSFYYLCGFDYYFLVEDMLRRGNIDINIVNI